MICSRRRHSLARSYGVNIKAAVRELFDRWNAGDMHPRLLETATLIGPTTRPRHSLFHRNNVIFRWMFSGHVDG
jgi:hypothetical protein